MSHEALVILLCILLPLMPVLTLVLYVTIDAALWGRRHDPD